MTQIRRTGLKMAVLLGLFLWILTAIQSAAAQSNEVLILDIEGPVTPAMAAYFDRAITAAEDEGATAVVIVLDTPGGAVDVTLDIVQSFRNASIPVIVYVGPAGAQAASAGSIITVAAHASGMAPETVIGAASPVDSSGADIEETLFQKISEDLKATMRNLTERRGESAVALAEAMIEDAKAVTAKEALDAQLIDAVASDVPDLLAQLDGLNVVVNEESITLQLADAAQDDFPMNLAERLLHALSNPLIIGLLLTIGVQAILIEISNPGGWVAGFIGVLFVGMGLYGLGTLPANWLGLGLIILAFVLFILEVKTPTTGFLAAAGTVTFAAGLLVLFNSPGSPEFSRISISGAIGISLFTAAFFLFLVAKVVSAQRRPSLTGPEGLVGQVGPVKKDFSQTGSAGKTFQGTVLVNGELWRAVSDESIVRDEQVVVKEVDGFTLRVKRVAGDM